MTIFFEPKRSIFGLAFALLTATTLFFGGIFPVQAQEAKLSPKDAAMARVQLAVAYFSAGRTLEASEEASKALKFDPDNSAAYVILGGIAYVQKDMPQAEKHYQKAISLDPANGDAHHNYALLLCASARAEKALEEFAKALSSIRYTNAASSFTAAGLCVARAKNDMAAAEQYFRRALEIEPMFPMALFHLANALAAQQRFPEAKIALERLLRNGPPNSQMAYLNWAIAKRMGDERSEKTFAERLRAQWPDSQEAQKVLVNTVEFKF